MENSQETVSYGATDTNNEIRDESLLVGVDGSNVSDGDQQQEDNNAENDEALEGAEEQEEEEEEGEESFVTIQVDNRDTERPTLAPIGSRLKRNAQIAYNPFDWSKTIWVLKGRPYVSTAFYIVGFLGAVLVFISSLNRFHDEGRHCRAWCTVFSLSTDPHQYIGFILFLLMSFRTSNSYQNYVAGQKAFYTIKTQLRLFSSALLAMTPRGAVTRTQRARMLAYAICFPFALTSELRMERRLDRKAVAHCVSDADLDAIMAAPSMAQFVLESLHSMVHLYVPASEKAAKKALHAAVAALYAPYAETERIQFNPMGFAYVVHLRLLLLMYLVTLPLAFVEKLGFATILVHWVITYALMSLEMLAVGVENPFGHEASDLRLFQYNVLMRDAVMESWEEWEQNLGASQENEALIESYDNFGKEKEASIEEHTSWFFFY